MTGKMGYYQLAKHSFLGTGSLSGSLFFMYKRRWRVEILRFIKRWFYNKMVLYPEMTVIPSKTAETLSTDNVSRRKMNQPLICVFNYLDYQTLSSDS